DHQDTQGPAGQRSVAVTTRLEDLAPLRATIARLARASQRVSTDQTSRQFLTIRERTSPRRALPAAALQTPRARQISPSTFSPSSFSCARSTDPDRSVALFT